MQGFSRAGDQVLYTLAEASQAAVVVVDWWNHDMSPARLRGSVTPGITTRSGRPR